MNSTSRQALWVSALAVVLTASGAPNLAAAPQSERGMERGKGHNRPLDAATAPNFQQGLRDGRDDRANNRPHQYRERADPRNNNVAQNRAYEAGYDQGFFGKNGDQNRDRERIGDREHEQNRGRDRGREGDDDRDDDRGRRNDRVGINRSPAAKHGFQDGVSDGQRDRQTGQSNRPTQGGNYKNATHGFDTSLGNLDQYKAAYRQAYIQGYQRGYTGGR